MSQGSPSFAPEEQTFPSNFSEKLGSPPSDNGKGACRCVECCAQSSCCDSNSADRSSRSSLLSDSSMSSDSFSSTEEDTPFALNTSTEFESLAAMQEALEGNLEEIDKMQREDWQTHKRSRRRWNRAAGWTLCAFTDIQAAVEVLKGIADKRDAPPNVLEVGAGLAYFSRLLRTACRLSDVNAEFILTDVFESTYCTSSRFMEQMRELGVKEMDAQLAVQTFSAADVLTICWPVWGFAEEALQSFRGRFVFYCGEGPSGCCADKGFFRELQAGWVLQFEAVRGPAWRRCGRDDDPESDSGSAASGSGSEGGGASESQSDTGMDDRFQIWRRLREMPERSEAHDSEEDEGRKGEGLREGECERHSPTRTTRLASVDRDGCEGLPARGGMQTGGFSAQKCLSEVSGDCFDGLRGDGDGVVVVRRGRETGRGGVEDLSEHPFLKAAREACLATPPGGLPGSPLRCASQRMTGILGAKRDQACVDKVSEEGERARRVRGRVEGEEEEEGDAAEVDIRESHGI
uniref:Methyltransferase domain-containing protein n=1 Tax=Chromera velia CCMP2878 TaxID=1169474 RepID=A0A0G4I6J5_9ALVE|eukprot:Cvel_11437.t1-p1 / transcript=Cvel_11437.t1 / gene=Cvel_11437 / organism=Chromera_velia_CCMP2878 / gene_product=hypothetical protein / transcript_product=hypothetical protein / location=Cvel_scaffold719:45621-47632(-) / protein_length=517 / sequence_SO=supercontig / SO=protein_coding / is_pseudo=false